MTTAIKEQHPHKKPPISFDEADSCCNEIINDFHIFNKDIKIITVLTGLQNTSKTLLQKQNEILEFPEGQNLNNLLKAQLEHPEHKTKLIGIISEEKSKFFGLKTVTKYTALICVNAINCENKVTLTAELYRAIWKTYSIISDIKNEDDTLTLTKNGITTAKWNNEQIASRNMFADIFAGSLSELKGQKSALKTIAKQRCISCFDDLYRYDARTNPLPIMLENAQMAFEDVKNAAPASQNDIECALNIVTEIIETMDENTIRQWQNFISLAQEMAWAGISTSQILGAAIYTSDNVYNRTSAHMIAETLNTNPAPIIEFQGYNAFSDPDSQQRNHKLACLETFEYAYSECSIHEDKNIFTKLAEQACELLLDAKPNGFCAPALIALAQEIENDPDHSKETLSKRFSEQINALPWDAIRELNRDLITLRKGNRLKGLASIIDVLRQNEDTRDSALLIKQLADQL